MKERKKEMILKSVNVKIIILIVIIIIIRLLIIPVGMRENTDQKKLRIWTHFTQRRTTEVVVEIIIFVCIFHGFR